MNEIGPPLRKDRFRDYPMLYCGKITLPYLRRLMCTYVGNLRLENMPLLITTPQQNKLALELTFPAAFLLNLKG